MKGDFSRSTFDKSKHYSKVKMQQGRVQVDADWNEQVDIQSYHNIATLSDVIGQSGTSDKDAFRLQVSGSTYSIGKGRYYVGGLVAENDESISDGIKWQQEHNLPSREGVLAGQSSVRGMVLPKDDGYYIAFLELWEHHLTSLEEPEMKEPALGGPDTSTRVKTIWQVKLLYAGTTRPSISENQDNLSTLFSVPDWAALTDTNVGKLSARAKPVERKKDDLCAIPLSAGYSGLENQLYRVEIHTAAEPGKEATFKFAKNNATTVAKISKITGDKISIGTTGKDASLGFADGKIGEIIDDRYEMWGLPGILGRLSVDPANSSMLIFKPEDGLTIKETDFPSTYNPKIRMWERKETVKIPSDNDGFIPLEHGIQIKFDNTVPYRSGDYWLIPARSFMLNKSSLTEESTLGDILWPKDNAKNPQFVSSQRVPHKVWPLSLLRYLSGNFTKVEADYRQIFPPLQDLVSFQYVGGDGQAAGPSQMLAAPLSVGVSLGDKPISGVSVIFRVTTGNGLLFAENDANTGAGGQRTLPKVTDANGLAQCYFKIDDQTQNQVVEAVMIDVFGRKVHLPILFNGSLLLNSPSTGLNARSGLVPLDIPAQSYKIIGPFIHGANELTNNTVPPAIILGQRNEHDNDDPAHPTDEKILQMQDLTDIILLNSRFGITQPTLPIPNEISPLVSQMGLDQILSSNGENIPILFKPIMIDHRQFYILAINYNKKSIRIVWTPWTQIERSAKIQQMAIGKNKDGRLEVFAITDSSDVAHLAQVPPNLGWASAWSPFPGIKATQIAVANNQDGRLEVFIIDVNGLIHHNWQTAPSSSAWSGWARFSEFKVTQLTVGQNQDGRLQVFAIRSDDEQVWHTAQVRPNSAWHPWVSLPSVQIKLKAKKIAVANNQDGRLELFVIGAPVKTQVTTLPERAGFEFDFPIGVVKAKEVTTSPVGPIAGGGVVGPIAGGGVVARPPDAATTGGGGVVARPPDAATTGGVVARPTGATIPSRDIAINREVRPVNRLGLVRTGEPTEFARSDIDLASTGAVEPRVLNAADRIEFARSDIDLASTGAVEPRVIVANPNVGTISIPVRPIIIEIQTDDDAIWHRWQNEPNVKDNWSDWEILSGLKTTELAVARNQDGRLEVFAIQPGSPEIFTILPLPGGTQNVTSALYHRYQLTPNARSSINWSRWTSLGGNPDRMAITMDDSGRLEVFVLARRSRLILSSGITVDSQHVINVLEREGIKEPDSVDKRSVNEIFSNNAIVSRWEPETAVTNIDAHKIKGLLKMKDIPDFRSQSSVYRISQTDPSSITWTGWDSLGGGNISKLAISNNAINQMVVFATTTSMDLWTLTQLPNDLHVEIRWWAIPTSSLPS